MRLRIQALVFPLAIMLITSACNFGGSSSGSTATAPATTDIPAAATLAATAAVPATSAPTAAATTAIPATTAAPAPTKAVAAVNTAIPATTAAPAPTKAATAPNTAIPATTAATVPTKAATAAATAISATVAAIAPTTAAPTTAVKTQAATAAVAQVSTQTTQAAQPTQAATSAQVSGVNVPDTLPTPRVLAWNPNTSTLGWYAENGQPINLTDKITAKYVLNCAVSGDRSVVYLGSDQAQPLLYPLNGGPLTPLGVTSGVTCAVPGRTAFSPDGKRLGLIKYPPDAFKNDFWAGTLSILNMPDASEAHNVSDVNSFRVYNDGVLFFQIFASTNPNNKGQGTSASLRWWDGSSERALEEDIKPLQDCQMVTGRALRVADKVYTLLGEKCKGSNGGSWRIIRTDFAGGNSINLPQANGATRGAYFGPSNTNEMWLMPDNASVLIATPNGLAGNIIDLTLIALADGKQTPIIPSVVSDQFPPTDTPRLLRSPAGDKMAFVTRDANQAETLYLYDLSTPTVAPVQVAGGNRGDRITNVAWAPNSQRIYYVTTGDTNALYYQGINNGDHKLVLRGTFQGLAISPDGTLAATTKQIKAATNDTRSNLILISIADEKEITLVEGSKGDAALTPMNIR